MSSVAFRARTKSGGSGLTLSFCPPAGDHDVKRSAVRLDDPSPSRRRTFQRRVLQWYEAHGRDLPWRRTRDPYAILVAEILLQQTQVRTVIPHYERFLRRYPTVQALAGAPLAAIKRLTDPLGYKIRGSWLKTIALRVAEERAGYFPQTLAELQLLPGVGRSTAGAVMNFAFHQDAPILDTNVTRLLGRYFGAAGGKDVRRRLWELSARVIPPGKGYRFNQALMDLGALVCMSRAPRCRACPLRQGCRWRRDQEAGRSVASHYGSAVGRPESI